MLKNYTKEELKILIKKLYTNMCAFETGYGDSHPFFRGIFTGSVYEEGDLKNYFLTNNFYEIITRLVDPGTFYLFVWSGVKSLLSRNIGNKLGRCLLNSIIEWKYEIDYTPEEIEKIRQKSIGKLSRVIEEVRKIEEARMLLHKEYEFDEICAVVSYLNDNSPYKSREEERKTIASNIWTGVWTTTDEYFYSSSWKFTPGILNDLLFFLLKPLEDMPLYIYSTLYRGAAAKWRLRFGK